MFAGSGRFSIPAKFYAEEKKGAQALFLITLIGDGQEHGKPEM